jgi:hypothetical protein
VKERHDLTHKAVAPGVDERVFLLLHRATECQATSIASCRASVEDHSCRILKKRVGEIAYGLDLLASC